jgi:hypothetical protein
VLLLSHAFQCSLLLLPFLLLPLLLISLLLLPFLLLPLLLISLLLLPFLLLPLLLVPLLLLPFLLLPLLLISLLLLPFLLLPLLLISLLLLPFLLLPLLLVSLLLLPLLLLLLLIGLPKHCLRRNRDQGKANKKRSCLPGLSKYDYNYLEKNGLMRQTFRHRWGLGVAFDEGFRKTLRKDGNRDTLHNHLVLPCTDNDTLEQRQRTQQSIPAALQVAV